MKKLCVFLASIVFVGINFLQAQNVQVTGTVTSAEDGMPIPGASIMIKGTTTGVATNIDGKYTISVPEAATTLVVRFIGMTTQEVIVAGRTVIDVVLEPDVTTLEEIVVTAYGTATKQAFTGSASTVSAETIEKRQVSNVSNALSGAVAGVQVQSGNGQPGTSATVRIRGVGSINAESDPLYVVDGIPFDGDLSSINPSDIESMTVLKDASSTALYGARGANGIIMITTKKGSSAKSQITFDMKLGVNSRALENYDVLTSTNDYLENVYTALYHAALYNLNRTPAVAHAYANANINTNTNGGFGYTIHTLPAGESLFGQDGRVNPNAVLGYSDGDYYYTPDNWADETFQNNMRQEYNLSMSGGTETQSYYLSFNKLDDKGIVSGSGFDRFSGRLKADQKFKDWLKVGANISYNRVTSQYPGEQTNASSSMNAFFIANFIAPVYPIYVRDAATQNIMRNQGRKVYDYGDGHSTNFNRSFMSIANPAGDLTYDKTQYVMDIMNTSWFAELTPLKGLTLTARYGINLDNTHYNNMGNAYMGQSASYGGTVFQQQDRIHGFDQQYVALYEFELNDENKFDITVGYDGYTFESEYVYAAGQNLYNPENYYVSNAIDNKRGGGRKNTYATQGYFGRLNYALKDKYYANLAFRRDASSRFHPDNRWGNFWAASGAWIISKESFMADLSMVNMLKLKASYGQQGNDAIGNYYAYLDQFQVTGADGVFSDGTQVYKGNPDITWETSTTYNVGIDFSLFNRLLSGSVEYFGRKSTDMLYYKPVQGSMGYTEIPMNIGSMTNSGLEIDLLGRVVSTQRINVSIFANATMIKNKINELHPDLHGRLVDGSRVYEEGYSMYRMFLVDYAGVDPETGKALYWAQEEDADGNLSPIKTDNYVLALDHKIITDDLLPKVYGGFGLSADAFGFDASIQFSYQLGGQIYDSGYARLMHGGTPSYGGNNWHTDIYNAWTPDNTNTDVPRLDANDKDANSSSTRFVTSSDYLSLNNITFGYTLPSRVVNKIKIEKLRLYVSADNVALLSSRKGLDPRQSYTAATSARYAPIRTVSGGILLTF